MSLSIKGKSIQGIKSSSELSYFQAGSTTENCGHQYRLPKQSASDLIDSTTRTHAPGPLPFGHSGSLEVALWAAELCLLLQLPAIAEWLKESPFFFFSAADITGMASETFLSLLLLVRFCSSPPGTAKEWMRSTHAPPSSLNTSRYNSALAVESPFLCVLHDVIF